MALILAWIRPQDLAPLGYPGWLAFTREHVAWGEAWIRSLVRLVESGLEVVLEAAREGRVPLAVAVTAPTTCAPDRQSEWVDAAMVGAAPRARRGPAGVSATVDPTEADALAIWHARKKVCLLEGLPLTDDEADERILGWWRAGRTAEELLAAALAPAPPPRPAPGPTTPDGGVGDPADPILGPWRRPNDLHDAIELLAEVQAARSGRVLELGRLYEQVVREGQYRIWGYPDVESFCQTVMGLSARSLQRHRELARNIRTLPTLGEAAARLSLGKVEAISKVASVEDVDRWVAVAERTCVTELKQATRRVAAGADPEELLWRYEAIMERAATDTVALASVQAFVPATSISRVHPDLPAAARWLLAIRIPPQRGFGRVKERDAFVCANPECRRRALRNQAHHLIFRRDGGDDTLANGVCVCPSCHLRLIHAGYAHVEKAGAALIWRLPGRTITVALGL